MRAPALTVLLVAVLLPVALQATERESLLQITFRSTFPELPKEGEKPEKPPKPLLVYVLDERDTRDQNRFEEVALENESFLLAARFFDRVRIWDSQAKKHPLLKDIKFAAPAIVAFDSTRKEHAIAGGRASGMKAYALLVKIGQVDYETSISKTVREARNLLGSFDRVDAARDALGIKHGRLEEARGKGDEAKIKQLEKELEADREKIETLHAKARKRWGEIWTLERKKR